MNITRTHGMKDIVSLTRVLLRLMNSYDVGLYLHSLRVSSTAERICSMIGKGELRPIVSIAGKLHDVGKLMIPSRLVLKNGKLNCAEQSEMRLHPVYSVDLILEYFDSSITDEVWDIILAIKHHHERLDGKGYPSGLKGDAIPLPARIVGLADVYCALTEKRPYRNAYSLNRALKKKFEELKKTGAFDPHLVSVMLKEFWS